MHFGQTRNLSSELGELGELAKCDAPLEAVGQNTALPLLVSRTTEHSVCEWARENRALIDAAITRHGGILFRGFGLATAGELAQFITMTSDAPLAYMERSSPRSQVEGNIYTSTDYPPNQAIFLHNEQSYNLRFPLRIYFACLRASASAGETPIADCRRVFARLSPATIDLFRDGYLYVRTFGAGPGLSWREAFQTDDRSTVEKYCAQNRIECEWLSKGGLRTRQLRQAFARHPRTGELVWFNHCTFFHLSTLPALVQTVLRKQFSAGELPNQTYLANGAEIDASITEELRTAYETETRVFPWQTGDVLMLDNMLVAHGRRPFTGARQVIVGMAELQEWDHLAAGWSAILQEQ